jgi:hypothetical protein
MAPPAPQPYREPTPAATLRQATRPGSRAHPQARTRLRLADPVTPSVIAIARPPRLTVRRHRHTAQPQIIAYRPIIRAVFIRGHYLVTRTARAAHHIPRRTRTRPARPARPLLRQQPHRRRRPHKASATVRNPRIALNIGRPLQRPYPDRIILGELRGSEAFAFLRAIDTGHPGSMTTIHANSPDGAIEQLALLILQGGTRLTRDDIRHYVRRTISLFVQLDRVAGRRLVRCVAFPGIAASTTNR